ncbi:MAG: ABC transporter permease [Thermoplasmatales archaeon]|nr:ABC transporter permease [Thermoplasmatales archaeon]
MSFWNILKGKFNELYAYRYLYQSLVKRSLYGKYKNSVLGFLWNFITPAVSILLFFVVFENFMGREIPNYWAYLCIGMFPFTFMNTNLAGGASSITSNSSMVKKMHFPREILPLSQVTYTFVIFLIAYAIVIVLMILVGMPLNPQSLLAFPIVAATMFLFSLGTILLTSAISVYSRDFEYLVTALSRILFWITPIIYTTDILAGILSRIIWINPLTYYVEGMHDIFYLGIIPDMGIILACTILAIVMFLVGVIVFARLKDGFAERI